MKIMNIADIQSILPPGHYDLDTRRLVDETMSDKGLRAASVIMQPSGGGESHVHDADHLFIVLKGEMVFKTEKGEERLKAGHATFIPSGEVHENYNGSDGETEYIVVTCFSQ